jgi:pyruvate dehydrogenase E2 component (dihydrolipoamide acetyltransferase)
MSNYVVMPKLGLTMESGVIIRWNKHEGDRVERGDVLLEVESDKSTVEVEAQYAGILIKQYFYEGTEIPCGDVIAVIGKQGDPFPGRPPRAHKEGTSSSPPLDIKVQPEQQAGVQGGEVKIRKAKIIASPRARRYAYERGIDLSCVSSGSGAGGRIEQRDVIAYENAVVTKSETKVSPLAQQLAVKYGVDTAFLRGSGSGGRILKEDVLYAIEKQQEENPLAGDAEPGAIHLPVSKTRAIIAQRLSKSKFTSPHFYLQLSVDMRQAVATRNEFNNLNPGKKVGWNSIFVKVVSIAFRKHPYINSSLRADTVILHQRHDIAVAAATESGLLAPVVCNCQSKTITQIEEKLRELIRKARNGKLTPVDYQNSTFTISNLGMYDIENFTAIINPPAAAILAVGKITERAVVVDHEIAVRPMINLILSCDHRVIDGAIGAAFLKEVKNILQTPLLDYFCERC